VPKKLTNEIIDERLIGRLIRRIGEYFTAETKLEFQCLTDTSHIWKARPNNVIHNNASCPYCSGHIPLSNEIIDKKLLIANRPIKRISDYLGVNDKKIYFKCLIDGCDHEWSATPKDVVGKHQSGCPKCSGLIKLTNEELDLRLLKLNKKVRRIGNYIGMTNIIEFECLTCDIIFKNKPSYVLANIHGCSFCAGTAKITNDMIDGRIKNNNIIRLSDALKSNENINFKCLVCDIIWDRTPSCIMNRSANCPYCIHKGELNNKIVDDRLLKSNRKIKRIGNYINTNKNIQFQCLNDGCGKIWEATTNSVLDSRTGCPYCCKNARLTDEIIDNRLYGRNIQRLDSYAGKFIKIRFKCTNDGCTHIWHTYTSYILHEEPDCPNCVRHLKNETIVFDTLKNNNFEIKRQYAIKKIINDEEKRLRVDFYIPDKNIIIEYNGAQHYKPNLFFSSSEETAKIRFEKQVERDLYLQQFCDKYNIKLIWIDGRKYVNSKLEKYVINTIIPEINNHQI
jgi:hypothetical protein